jgi:hypothetical protein
MMTNKFNGLLLFYLFFCISVSQSQNFGVGSYHIIHHSIGSTYLNGFSPLNPSSIAIDTSDRINFSIKPSKFGISELNPILLNGNFSIDSNWLAGVSIYNLGGELYSEFSGELKIATKVSDIIAFGMSLETSRLHIKNYENQFFATFNVGTVIILSDNLNAGFVLRNLLRNHTTKADKTIYQESIFGISYQIDEYIFFDSDVAIVINSLSSLSVGLKYIPDKNFAFRTAFRTNPQILEIGSSINLYNELNLIMSIEYNSIFGISPEISFNYIF